MSDRLTALSAAGRQPGEIDGHPWATHCPLMWLPSLQQIPGAQRRSRSGDLVSPCSLQSPKPSQLSRRYSGDISLVLCYLSRRCSQSSHPQGALPELLSKTEHTSPSRNLGPGSNGDTVAGSSRLIRLSQNAQSGQQSYPHQ